MQNIVILAGNIGNNPESRITQGETSVTTFSLATSRPRYHDGKIQKDADGRRIQDTEWHRITCFNGLGKTVMEHCRKGMKVLVRGRLHYSNWTDNDGIERYNCEIIAETVDFLSRAKEDNANTAAGNGYGNDCDDEIPF